MAGMERKNESMNDKNRIIELVNTIKRTGTDKVLEYLDASSYFTRGCCSHHTGEGGLARHSLEVYDHMRLRAGGLPPESIVVAALFHDLGKTRPSDGRGHGQRSLDILEECGLPLTDDERKAIAYHCGKAPAGRLQVVRSLICCKLLRLLIRYDMVSTGRWKAGRR